MFDKVRKIQQVTLNAVKGSREELEKTYEKVWDTEQLRAEFKVLGFMAPYVVVERLSDGKKGSLLFQHEPRFYFEFEESE